MKKIFVLIMAAAAISFTACDGNKTEGAAAEDSLATDTVATVADPVAALTEAVQTGDPATIVEALKTATNDIVNLSDEQKAEYTSKLKAFVEEHKDKLEEIAAGNATLAGLVSTIKELPTSATDAATDAVDAAKADASEAVENVKDAASEKAEEVKAAAEKKVNDAVNDATQKATDAASDAIDKAAEKTKKSLGL